MQYQLSLTINSQPESLERVLRVVRHRGFELLECRSWHATPLASLELVIGTKQPISLLTKQLAKLFCVDTVTSQQLNVQQGNQQLITTPKIFERRKQPVSALTTI